MQCISCKENLGMFCECRFCKERVKAVVCCPVCNRGKICSKCISYIFNNTLHLYFNEEYMKDKKDLKICPCCKLEK